MTANVATAGGRRDDSIESRLAVRVEEIVGAARKAAVELRDEVALAAKEHATSIETAAARRSHAVLSEAEAEAERIVAAAQASTQLYLAASRRLVDEFAGERKRRIAAIGDRLAEQAEALLDSLSGAGELASQLDALRHALGAAAARIADEAAREDVTLPELPIGSRPPGTAGEAPDDRLRAAARASREPRLARTSDRPRICVVPSQSPSERREP